MTEDVRWKQRFANFDKAIADAIIQHYHARFASMHARFAALSSAS